MSQPRPEFLAVLCATLAMIVARGVGRFTLSTPLLPELIAQQIFAFVTPRLFTATLRVPGFGAKWVAFGLAVAGDIGGGLGLGWLIPGRAGLRAAS